jgi:predicted alpha/beta superfamily hydrolase
MRHRYFSITVFLSALLVACFHEVTLAASYEMADTQMHVMQTSDTRNQDYMLYVQLPTGYEDPSNRDKHYPVIYLLDPYWDFPVVAGARSGLVFDGIVPEYIVVGIGYSTQGQVEEGDIVNILRQIDYTPVRDTADANTGDAAAFMSFIKSKVMPFVEDSYRIADYRVFAGTSWGGLFSLYLMFENPGMFQGHIAIAPAVGHFHRWAFVKESLFYGADPVHGLDPAGQALPTRLYMSVGSNDQLGNFTRESIAFSELLKGREYEGLNFIFEVKQNEHHASVKLASFGQALKHAFGGYDAR